MKPTRLLSLPEFITMSAVIFATLAFSIDAMLPAFPDIAAELTPDAVNRAQLIVLAFVLGMGVGTIFAGPLSDTYGRKIIITGGFAIYIIAAVLAFYAQSLEMILAARALQGLGAAGPRIVPIAMIRDLYEGRRMAQITSFITTVFMLVPAIAPSVGALIISIAGWRYIFVAFIVFSLIGGLWLNIRQPETLPPKKRRPLQFGKLRDAALEVVRNKMVMIYTAALTLAFTQLFALIASTQQIYDLTYGRGENFHLWFALTALLAATGTILNARLVMRQGMRRLATIGFVVQGVSTLIFLIVFLSGYLSDFGSFVFWFIWSVSIFFTVGFTLGNLNALALQPLGHIAGMAASVISAISTIVAVFFVAPIGLAFDGTPVPLLIGTLICAVLAYLLMRRTTEPVEDQA